MSFLAPTFFHGQRLRSRHFQPTLQWRFPHKTRPGPLLTRTPPTRPPAAIPPSAVDAYSRHGRLLGRVDLAWPDIGVFIELDGEHHKDQPVHDARRETAVVAATGWLPGRFTWTEVTRVPKSTARRLVELHEARNFPARLAG